MGTVTAAAWPGTKPRGDPGSKPNKGQQRGCELRELEPRVHEHNPKEVLLLLFKGDLVFQ